MEVLIRNMTDEDWRKVAEIYRQGISTGLATLETVVPKWEDWDKEHLEFARLIAYTDGKVHGWAALSPVSNRCVYGGVAEVSVYVAENSRGYGIGKKLLQALIIASEENGIWTLQAGIFPENKASCKLHENLGFRLLGVQERISKLNAKWMNVARYEKRSDKVGMD